MPGPPKKINAVRGWKKFTLYAPPELQEKIEDDPQSFQKRCLTEMSEYYGILDLVKQKYEQAETLKKNGVKS